MPGFVFYQRNFVFDSAHRHIAIGSGVQDLNYAYNIRGWLSTINTPGTNPPSGSKTLFNMGLYYNSVPSGITVNALYNGNISAMVWNTPAQSGTLSPADKQGYGFTYDGLNRLKTSSYGEGSSFASYAGANNENYNYDLNGNLTSLTRYLRGTGQIDLLSYTYKNGGASNQLDRVDDTATYPTIGFYNGVSTTGEYSYDSNGNLTSDLNKGHNQILYNYLNLPKRVGTSSQYIRYIYSADGTKLAKVGTGGVYTYYPGRFVYSESSLTMILTSEGKVLPGGSYQYFLKDHLGNTRMVVSSTGSIVQQTDYYPFGLEIASYTGGTENKYLYNGKEKQDDIINSRKLDWYDYGARFYDPSLGRWHSVDALAEDYYDLSPYNYAGNNPICFIDPDGNFKTRFGAWLYSVFNGGGDILQDKGGEYFVGQKVENEGDADITYKRSFDWGGRGEGKDLALEAQIDAFITQNNFARTLDQAGIEYSYTNNRGEALRSMIGLSTMGLLPNPLLKSATAIVNGGKVTGSTLKSISRSQAEEVARAVGGTVSELKNGYKITIPVGRKPLTIRLMNAGSGGRANAYGRISIDGKGSFTTSGTLSNDRGLTHFDLNPKTMVQDIKNVVNKIN